MHGTIVSRLPYWRDACTARFFSFPPRLCLGLCCIHLFPFSCPGVRLSTLCLSFTGADLRVSPTDNTYLPPSNPCSTTTVPLSSTSTDGLNRSTFADSTRERLSKLVYVCPCSFLLLLLLLSLCVRVFACRTPTVTYRGYTSSRELHQIPPLTVGIHVCFGTLFFPPIFDGVLPCLACSTRALPLGYDGYQARNEGHGRWLWYWWSRPRDCPIFGLQHRRCVLPVPVWSTRSHLHWPHL